MLADAHGNVVHLGERECSLQRRHQKVIEEAPSPVVDAAAARAHGRRGRAISPAPAATRARARSSSSSPAMPCPTGRGRLLLPRDEHASAGRAPGHRDGLGRRPGRAAAARCAAASRLRFAQDDLAPSGHAIEARLYSEDPAAGFLPAIGTVQRLRLPEGPGVRVDAGIAEGSVIGADYDPMLAKVIAHGPDRETALGRLDRALAEPRAARRRPQRRLQPRAARAATTSAPARIDTGLLERVLAEGGLGLERSRRPRGRRRARALARRHRRATGVAPGPWRRGFAGVGRRADRPPAGSRSRASASPHARAGAATAGSPSSSTGSSALRDRPRAATRSGSAATAPRCWSSRGAARRRRPAVARGRAGGADAGQGAARRGRQRRHGRGGRRAARPRVDEDGAADHGARRRASSRASS